MKNIILSKSTFLFLLAFMITASTYAQDCKFFYPTQVGTILEFTHYNKKGKVESVQTQKVVEQKMQNGATVVVIEATTPPDKQHKDGFKTTFEVKCDEGKFYVNMDDFTSAFNYEQYQSVPNMEVNVSTEGMFYPSDMSVGQDLPAGAVEITIAANGIDMFATNVAIKNRKVEAAEKIATPTGTFDCLKITADVVTTSMMTIESKTVQWLCEGIGVVKSETLDKDGKTIGYQLLTKITK